MRSRIPATIVGTLVLIASAYADAVFTLGNSHQPDEQTILFHTISEELEAWMHSRFKSGDGPKSEAERLRSKIAELQAEKKSLRCELQSLVKAAAHSKGSGQAA